MVVFKPLAHLSHLLLVSLTFTIKSICVLFIHYFNWEIAGMFRPFLTIALLKFPCKASFSIRPFFITSLTQDLYSSMMEQVIWERERLMLLLYCERVSGERFWPFSNWTGPKNLHNVITTSLGTLLSFFNFQRAAVQSGLPSPWSCSLQLYCWSLAPQQSLQTIWSQHSRLLHYTLLGLGWAVHSRLKCWNWKKLIITNFFYNDTKMT